MGTGTVGNAQRREKSKISTELVPVFGLLDLQFEFSQSRDGQTAKLVLNRKGILMKAYRTSIAVGLVLIAVLSGSSVALEPPDRESRGAAPERSGEILFSCDFQSDNWYKQWSLRKPDVHTRTVAADPRRKFQPLRGKALRIKVDRGGHYGASLQFNFRKRLGKEPEEIYFRYYLRLADDWDPARGGKLPGIAGTYGRAGWGGRKSNGRDGWSARGLFRGQKDGKTPVGFYCYHADMKGQYGENWLWEKDRLGYLQNNRWYCIEQYAKMNTPGRTDGILRAWVDGRGAFEKTDVRMRHVDTLKIETVWLNVYLGGTWTSQSDHHLYIDEVVISPEYIGLLPQR